MPLFSVIVPVYNREEKLRRALQSVAAQTLSDFECLVVDDGSTQPLRRVVDEFDERFIYVRRDANGGCTAARHTGMSHAAGEYFTSLDSDNELYPWALDRAAYYLDRHPEADGATGLYVFPDGLHMRVSGGVKVVGPDEYIARSTLASRGDSVGIVRRSVVDEWLRLRPDYYNLDLVFVLRFRLSHQVVLVDEPWGRYDTTTTDKIARRRDPRAFDDMVKFVEEFRPVIGKSPCSPVDMILSNMWIRLMRAHRYREAATVAAWMRARRISRPRAVVRKIGWGLRTRAAGVVPMRSHVL